MYTIAVCDTQPIAVEGLARLLESAEGLRVVAAEYSLPEATEAVRELRPSLVLVDKALGVPAILDWLVILRRSLPPVPVVVWGVTLSDSEALRFMQSGVSGMVRKTAPLDSILTCIRRVAEGGTWLEDSLDAAIELSARPVHSPLTAREMQVLELVERGMKNKDIAVSLGIRLGTVKIHIKHIFEKTGVRGRYGLAISGIRQKGIPSLVTQ